MRTDTSEAEIESSIGFDLLRRCEYAAASRVFRNELVRVPAACSVWQTMEDICQMELRDGFREAGDSVKINSQKESSGDLTVTLTTIASRLGKLADVVESLGQQSLKPKKILVNVSRDPYLLDEGVAPSNAVLRRLQSFSLVQLNWMENYGPYRKCFDFLKQHFSHSFAHEEVFVTVDDDTIYPEYFLEKLYEEYLRHECVVAFRGRLMVLSDQDGFRPYSEWGPGVSSPDMLNLATGKDGVIYSTRFFSPEVIDLTAAMRIAPTADDLWWKWHTAMNGIPTVVLNPEACTSDYKSFPLVDYSRDYRANSLYAVHNSGASRRGNDLTVSMLEEHFAELYGMTLSKLLRL